MDKKFNFNDIDEEIQSSNGHSKSELQIFRDFAMNYMQDNKNKSNLFQIIDFLMDIK